MTRKDALTKVAKLTRLANDPRTPTTESETARRQISKILLDNHLTPQDLATARMGEAFDDLVEEIKRIVEQHPSVSSGLFNTQKIVADVLNQIKSANDEDKAARLSQIVTIVRAVSVFMGGTPVVAELKTSIETALKNHEIVI